MSAAQFYAVITCVVGMILLLAWLYMTTDNPRSTPMLLKSILLFVLPCVGLAVISPSLVHFPLSLWIGTLVEELLKLVAARSEKNQVDRFFLVTLFGIWELTWAKPVWGLSHAVLLVDSTNLQLAGLSAAGLIAVLMHAATAEIYAFRFQGRILLALATSWLIHTAFDESVLLFGVSLIAQSLQLLVLTILFVALWPKGLLTSSIQAH